MLKRQGSLYSYSSIFSQAVACASIKKYDKLITHLRNFVRSLWYQIFQSVLQIWNIFDSENYLFMYYESAFELKWENEYT